MFQLLAKSQELVAVSFDNFPSDDIDEFEMQMQRIGDDVGSIVKAIQGI